MPQRMTLSRAARLVGVKRGTLQKQIRAGELPSFDGEIEIEGLLKLYPEAQLEDSSMIERVERIMDDAVCKVGQSSEKRRSLISSLAARVAYMGRDLADARQKLSDYRKFQKGLMERADSLQEAAETDTDALGDFVTWLKEQAEVLAVDPRHEPGEEFLLKDSMLKFMASHVRILPSGHDFFVEGSETILEAALRAGLSMGYGCNNGACGKCKAKIISGEVKKVKPHDFVLTEQDKLQRYVLTCSYMALTDVVLQAEEGDDPSAMPRQEIEARIRSLSYPQDHVMVLRVRTPRTQRLRFLGGQSAYVSVRGSERVLLPVASCPCDELHLDFHVYQDGHPDLWKRLLCHKPTDKVLVDGPLGEFVLQSDSMRSCMFLAFGTGFAAIKSLIEHAMALDIAEQLYLWWFSSEKQGGFYKDNLCRSWSDALDNFDYRSVDVPEADYSDMAERLKEMMEAHPDFLELDYYISGEEELDVRARNILINVGVPSSQIRLNTAT